MGIVVTGFPRAGTTLLYCMLRYCTRGWAFDDREHWRARPGVIVKSPRAVFHAPDPARCIVLLRDPRAILTSRHPSWPTEYFVSAHRCANDSKRGLCEWWAAIQRLFQGRRLPHVVRYESLITQPERVQRDLADALDIPFRGAFRDFDRGEYGDYWESALGGVRPLQGRVVTDGDRLGEQFERYPELRDVSAQMGYA